MISVTLDTNVLVEYWCNQHKAAVTKSVLNLAKHGKIELAITSRINADIPDLPLADRINELPVLNVQQIGSAFSLLTAQLGTAETCGEVMTLSMLWHHLKKSWTGKVERKPT